MNCRSCHAEIVFAVTNKGRRMPLDREPDPEGSIVWNQVEGTCRSYDGYELELNEVRATSHFATCPNAERHRRRP